jgi:adenylate cyclase class IV
LRSTDARRVWTRRQRDTFFAVPRGWLKLREMEGEPAELISYLRSTEDPGPRTSDYDVLRHEDAERTRRLLARVLPEEIVVVKERELWRLDHTRIHLDRVEGLGEFLELETVVEGISLEEAEDEARRIVEVLGLDPSRFVPVPYRTLLLEKEREA